MYWKDLQHNSVAVEEYQNKFSCHRPTVPEDETDVVHLNYIQKENIFWKSSLASRIPLLRKTTGDLRDMLQGGREKIKYLSIRAKHIHN